jgi:hypothetical protein
MMGMDRLLPPMSPPGVTMAIGLHGRAEGDNRKATGKGDDGQVR